MVVRLLSMGLDPRWRRLVVGIELWLLQMAWPSRTSPSVSATATALLVVAASLLSGVSTTTTLLVLRQRTQRPDRHPARPGGMPQEGRYMLWFQRRGAKPLWRSLLVLRQRTQRPDC